MTNESCTPGEETATCDTIVHEDVPLMEILALKSLLQKQGTNAIDVDLFLERIHMGQSIERTCEQSLSSH